MFADTLAVLWKENKEIFLQGPKLRGGWVGILVFIGVFGVLMPLQSGPEWVQSPATLLVWAWVPFILVNSVVADSFAGERERHTLETLLASRLSDLAILLGKIFAALLYGWGLTLISLFISLVAINLAYAEGGLLLFPAGMAVGILGLSFLVAWLAAGAGVLVSLRATSVRQAQQTLSTAMFIFLIPLFLLPLLPEEMRATATQALAGLNLQFLGWILAGILLAIDAGLLFLAVSRFKRERLILD